MTRPTFDGVDIYKLPIERRTLAPFLAWRERHDGDRPYMTFGARTWTFGEAIGEVRNVARGLARLGIGHGDYLAMMLPNVPEFVLAWYAAVLRGAAFVPINPQYRGFLLDAPLRETRTKGIVIHAELFEALATLDPHVAKGLEWIAVVGPMQGLKPPLPHQRLIPFAELSVASGHDPVVEASYKDIHSVMYTSGTTGPSKGVLISNAQFFSSACVFLRSVAMTRDDVLFTPLPLFHGLASRLGVFPAMMVGAHVVVAERFSAARFFPDAAACGATIGHTIFPLPPVIKAQPPAATDRNHKMRVMYNAHSDPEFEARFGVELIEAFGLTETGLVMFTDYPERRANSTGRIHEDFEVALVDDNDMPVPIGQPGEIILRPKKPWIMMQGYLDKPADTIRAWRNLWFHTGDIARRDADGFFYFVDRVKERIRRRGENISSWDVENYVGAHPAILECAAVGYPAPGGDDDVRVLVVLKPGEALTAPELIDWLTPRMPKFMLPRYVEVVPTLPRNPTGKIEKYKLAADGLGPKAYDREAAR